jgi:hypothetical protein
MARYVIRPGNIAAVCGVVGPDDKEHSCIYLDEENIEVGVTNKPLFSSFPQAVQDIVREHFSAVFGLPVHARGAHLKACAAREVEA